MCSRKTGFYLAALVLPHLCLAQVFFPGSNPTSSDSGTSSIGANEGSDNEVNLQSLLGLPEQESSGVFTRNNFAVTTRKDQTCTDPRGRPGTCNYIWEPQCSNVLRAIRTLGITRQVRNFLLKSIESPCGFEFFDFTLCCAGTGSSGSTTARPTTTTRRTTTTKATTTRRTTTTTTTTTNPNLNLDCGVQDVLRIVNGEKAEIGAWPWAAILGIPSSRNGIAVICGATIIKHDYVLTAAHCFDGRQDPSIVRIGDLDISTSSEVDHQDIRVKRFVIHPSYSKTTLKNDIALVQLESPIQFKFGIRPACLPDKYRGFPMDQLQNEPTIIGWGSTGNDRPTETKLMQTTVPIDTVSNCDRKYRPVQNIRIGSTQICAGFGSRDTCNGDSGGPMLSSELDNGRWAVIGITSFGVKCADENFPGVYTRVDQYLDWIERNSA